MKKLAALLMLTLFVIACSSTKNDLKMSNRRIPVSGSGSHGSAVAAIPAGESHHSTNSPSPASAPMYASSKKIVTMHESALTNSSVVAPTASASVDKDNERESIDQKVTLAQMEMFRQIEMDKAISTIELKKVMQRKVYTTEVRTLDDSTSPSAIISQDTVYSAPESGSWHPVE